MSLEGVVVDLHHLVTILLREHLNLEARFRQFHLAGVTPQPTTYLVQEINPESDRSDLPTDAKAFALNGRTQHLTGYDMETIFWRCKYYDDNITIVRAMQVLLNDLSASTTLRIRTAHGFQMYCSAHSFSIIRSTIRLTKQAYVAIIPTVAGSQEGTIITPEAERYCLGGPDGGEVWWMEL